jgi:DNA-binding response OmpR family regulator
MATCPWLSITTNSQHRMTTNNLLKIGILEDNEIDVFFLSSLLLKAGYSCFYREHAGEMIAALQNDQVDALILDWYLPDGDALDVIEFARESLTDGIPILIMSVDESPQILDSLNAGADDYIRKPLTTNGNQLLTRLNNLLVKYGRKKSSEPASRVVETGPLFRENQLLYREKSLELTDKEKQVIGFLLKMHGSLVYRESIFMELWDEVPSASEGKRLDSLMYRIRKKMRQVFGDDIQIENVHGFGYRLTYN